jgi:hypothetical protein
VALILGPTYSLPLDCPFSFFIAFATASGLTLQEEQIGSSLYIYKGMSHDLHSLFFPILFFLFICRYLAAIFSFVAMSLQVAEQYI